MAAPGQYKISSPEVIARAIKMYGDGLTLRQVGAAIGCHYVTLSRAFEREGVPRRAHGKRMMGVQHPHWKGDEAGYMAMHQRVRIARGKPCYCEHCGTSDPSLKYEWANKTGNYADIDDYVRLCAKCHNAMDRASPPRRDDLKLGRRQK